MFASLSSISKRPAVAKLRAGLSWLATARLLLGGKAGRAAWARLAAAERNRRAGAERAAAQRALDQVEKERAELSEFMSIAQRIHENLRRPAWASIALVVEIVALLALSGLVGRHFTNPHDTAVFVPLGGFCVAGFIVWVADRKYEKKVKKEVSALISQRHPELEIIKSDLAARELAAREALEFTQMLNLRNAPGTTETDLASSTPKRMGLRL